MGRRHRGGRRGRRARLHDGHRPGRAGARRHAQRRHLGRGPAPPYRARADQPAGGRRRQAVRQLGAVDADQNGRGHLRGQPQHRPGARLDLVLELRRLQPDLASPLRLPERRPDQGLRMGQQHAGRQELPDLRHPHQHRDAGRGLQHLPRPLRRRADGGDGERRGNDRPRPRRPCHHRPQDGRALFRHRRAEGHRGLLRPHARRG